MAERPGSRPERVCRIIRDATGTDLSDEQLTIYIDLFAICAAGVPWPRPRHVVHKAADLARSIRTLQRELSQFSSAHLHWTPRPIPDSAAVGDAIQALDRAMAVVRCAQEMAAQMTPPYPEPDEPEETNVRNNAAYNLAAYAALVFTDLSRRPAQWSKSKRDPFVCMVRALFEEFEVKGRGGRIADVERPIEEATRLR